MKRRYLLAIAIVLALVWHALRSRSGAGSERELVTSSRTVEPARPGAARKRARPPSNRPEPPLESCISAVERRCVDGDVWLVDSCGTPEQLLEECPDECAHDHCEDAAWRCPEPVEGRCAGDVVRLCAGGRVLAIDCAKKGMRCAIGSEGAECVARVAKELSCEGEDRCEGNVLVRCVQGLRERADCGGLNARCTVASGENKPRCVVAAAATPSPCGPCGCPALDSRENRCDGRDEDGDGLIDEGLDCGPVPVIAFLAQSEGRALRRANIEAELASINGAIAANDPEGKLEFALLDVVELDAPELRALDASELAELSESERIQGASEDFYVPLLFTDTILAAGDVPKPGIATLPNATCGRVQQGYGPEGGLVAVSELRYATTVAHELGHYLGLCHTHDAQQSEPLLRYRDASGEPVVQCEASCRGEGDGVCDTPEDPGPERCRYDESCQVDCAPEAAPDVRNVMSYYARCRESFSPEQIALMQHTAALRRGFHRCRDGRCACVPGNPICPLGMSCRPVRYSGQAAYRCALDGARGRSATCSSQRDCGHDLLCVTPERGEGRCVRPCLLSSSDCACVEAGLGFLICREDLKG